MKARHLLVAGLMMAAGVLFTWAMASGMQEYAMDRHGESTVGVAGATLVRSLHTAAETHWMF